MSLELSPVTESDLERWASLQLIAFQNHPMVPKGLTPSTLSFEIAQNRKHMESERGAHYLKVTEPATGELVALAKWKLVDDSVHNAPEEPAECAEEQNPEAIKYYFAGIDETRHETMGKKTYWCTLRCRISLSHNWVRS
jgi:hypothetical protein